MSSNAVVVLGGGAWGLTLADLLAQKGEQVTVWDRSNEVLQQLTTTGSRHNTPWLKVSSTVRFESNLQEAINGAGTMVCAVPSYAIRDVCQQLKGYWDSSGRPIFVSCSKGIEQETLLLPSQIVADVLGPGSDSRFAVLAGPSHAEEVCRGVPTSIVCCSCDEQVSEQVRDLFFLPTFRVYTQHDCKGVEIGGALKNVLAIAAGGCDGLGFGDNTKAALVTRGLAEIARLAAAMGAQSQTLSGLSGLGDLIVTCMSQHSRNRRFGELIASGLTPEQALTEVGAAVEGYRTAKSAYLLAQKLEVEMPLTTAVYQVLHEGVSLKAGLAQLLERDPRPEIY